MADAWSLGMSDPGQGPPDRHLPNGEPHPTFVRPAMAPPAQGLPSRRRIKLTVRAFLTPVRDLKTIAGPVASGAELEEPEHD